jgi:carbonic anhydrase/acetyltransferase-like protein (isoleucine patch superfamily)
VRGDEGQPIVVGDGSNIQDMVVLHALQTFEKGKVVESNLVSVDGKKYALYVGKGVSLAPQSQVHGPAAIGDHTFVGMQALVFRATIGKNVVIEPGATVIGVTIADERYVPAGMVVTSQAAADALPAITSSYAYAKLNDGVLRVNAQLAEGYLKPAADGTAPPGPAEPR